MTAIYESARSVGLVVPTVFPALHPSAVVGLLAAPVVVLTVVAVVLVLAAALSHS